MALLWAANFMIGVPFSGRGIKSILQHKIASYNVSEYHANNMRNAIPAVLTGTSTTGSNTRLLKQRHKKEIICQVYIYHVADLIVYLALKQRHYFNLNNSLFLKL